MQDKCQDLKHSGVPKKQPQLPRKLRGKKPMFSRQHELNSGYGKLHIFVDVHQEVCCYFICEENGAQDLIQWISCKKLAHGNLCCCLQETH